MGIKRLSQNLLVLNRMAQETIFHRKGELNSGWSFWENYRPAIKEEKGKKQENRFDDNLCVLFTFNN